MRISSIFMILALIIIFRACNSDLSDPYIEDKDKILILSFESGYDKLLVAGVLMDSCNAPDSIIDYFADSDMMPDSMILRGDTLLWDVCDSLITRYMVFLCLQNNDSLELKLITVYLKEGEEFITDTTIPDSLISIYPIIKFIGNKNSFKLGASRLKIIDYYNAGFSISEQKIGANINNIDSLANIYKDEKDTILICNLIFKYE